MAKIEPMRMRLTQDEFTAAASGSRFGGLAFEGARAVLVDGDSVRHAAKVRGISNSAVQQAVDRILARRAIRACA